MTPTIFALATAPGRGAVAVVRVSGPDAHRALTALAGSCPKPRRASVRTLKDPKGAEIDSALVLWLPGPASYTGEDSAEFHVHGGVAVVDALAQALLDLGLEPAEPGAFTRRAFENGKLDLAQAEAVADLIDAETEGQRRQALSQLGGALGRVHLQWREELVEILAQLEAAVDFPDEEVPADVADRSRPGLERLVEQVGHALVDARRGVAVREGYRIALIGAPNAGKSTLLNALAGRDAAIVTATPGTTRDIIEVQLVLGGYKVVVADTAGLRDTLDEIEAEGVRRARAWAADADLRIWVVDGSLEHGLPAPDGVRAGDICLINKADLPAGGQTGAALQEAQAFALEVHRVSAHRAEDLGVLMEALTGRVVEQLGSGSPPTATRLRHSLLLQDAHDRLISALEQTEAPELAAEDVRLAARALDRITGAIHPEDVLDRVFSSFCIGK
ncbi:MAG: tRNA uridine-5-carboxymethylaminomethyl(34) synthesis GTPase MnmE [Alphaproteobacteria bacterium PA2]|nr:MAG: tRNA uridine-5-carboxymethylaminomethyl(34) synthesis GTPase MnmE [Alphaproteobacteria bacterium PA2]